MARSKREAAPAEEPGEAIDLATFDPDDVDLDAIALLASGPDALEIEITGEIWTWRGPAPHHFLSVPPDGAALIGALARSVTYGWGMIPVWIHLNDRRWATSLWPKDGGYIVPLKADLRKAERLGPGDTVTLTLTMRA